MWVYLPLHYNVKALAQSQIADWALLVLTKLELRERNEGCVRARAPHQSVRVVPRPAALPCKPIVKN